MKSSIRNTQPEKRQAGAATLLMATVLLMAVSMIGVYSTRSGVVEQRVAANAIWNQQAMASAQSAMDNVFATNQESLSILAAGATTLRLSNDPNDKTAKSGSGIITVPANTIYTAEISSTDGFLNADLKLTVKGPGGVAEKKLSQRGRFAPYLKTFISGTITAIDNVVIPPIEVDSDIPVNPASRPPMCPRKAALLAKTANGKTGTSITEIKADNNVAHITPLGGLGKTPAQMDSDFLSDSAAHLREVATLYLDCTVVACTEYNIPNKQAGLIWVDGTLTLGNGAEIGDYGTGGDGSGSAPALLVVSGKKLANGTWVDANLKINKATVNGVVFVRGNWDNGTAASKSTVKGAVVAAGTGNGDGTPGNAAGIFKSTGNLNVRYNPWIVTNVMRIGSYARVAGSWADF